MLAQALLCLASISIEGDKAASLDKTGIQWTAPFEEALELARDQGRLLMIKPVAFGTDPKGGW